MKKNTVWLLGFSFLVGFASQPSIAGACLTMVPTGTGKVQGCVETRQIVVPKVLCVKGKKLPGKCPNNAYESPAVARCSGIELGNLRWNTVTYTNKGLAAFKASCKKKYLGNFERL